MQPRHCHGRPPGARLDAVFAMRTIRTAPAGRTVASRSSAHSFLGQASLVLDRALLELHSVQEMKEFWKMTKRVLHEALPLHFICLCLRPFAVMPSTVFREKAPFASEEEFKQFQELSPLGGYLAAHPGT